MSKEMLSKIESKPNKIQKQRPANVVLTNAMRLEILILITEFGRFLLDFKMRTFNFKSTLACLAIRRQIA